MVAKANEDLTDLYQRSLESLERQIQRIIELQNEISEKFSKMRMSNNPNREQYLNDFVAEYDAAAGRRFLAEARAQKLREELGL